jgi:type I restriction enzyme S subunit
MNILPYPNLRESGVPWLAEIPAHWQIMAIRRAAKRVSGKATSRTFAVALENIQSWTGRYVDGAGDYSGEGTSFQRGDILFGKLRPYLAKAWIADKAGEAVGDFHVIRCGVDLEPEFLHRYLLTREVISLINGSTFGAKMPRASWDFVGAMKFALPPKEDQNEIIQFLSVQAAKLDKAISAQEDLLRLTNEKQTAIFEEAVTLGISSRPAKKGSGLVWWGDVPTHWERFRLRRLMRSVQYGISEALTAETGIPILRMSNMSNGRLDFADLKFVKDVSKELLVRQDDLLFNRTNSPDLVGQVALVRELPQEDIGFASYLVRLRVTERARPAFLNYLLNTPRLLRYVRRMAFVAINQANLNPTRYGELVVFLPSVEEQDEIVKHIESELHKFSRLIMETEKMMALLRERRAALFFAAVTGKLDVRSARLPLEAAA